MKNRIITTFFVLLTTTAIHAQEGLKRVYNENINPLEQIDEALEKAKNEGKFVIAQVGGNWCPWCLRFADFIEKDEEISQIIRENFVYIHVNYKPRRSDNDEKAALAAATMKRLGSPQRFGFPVLVVLDAEGNVLHRQDSGFLEEGKSYDKKKVMQFLQCWTPQAVKE